MSSPVAVIDLGTNTFHLLIAARANGTTEEIIRRVDAVKLGEGGINNGIIRQDAFERGLQMMKTYAALITKTGATPTRAIATSAIRNAGNGQDFIDQVAKETGLEIEVIDGAQEAEFIYQGVKASGCLADAPSLIMDIGGGSVEFILCNQWETWWKQSFEIGAARLMDQFHQADPMTRDATAALEKYLEEQLRPLIDRLAVQPVTHLVGSAGAFETFVAMIESSREPEFNVHTLKAYPFDPHEFTGVMRWLHHSSHEDRAARADIDPVRVDMVVVASLLTCFVIKTVGITTITMSGYSLKEGVLATLLPTK